MGYHNNDPAWQANRLKEINQEANGRVIEIAKHAVASADFYPCNGQQPENRTLPLHDAAAVARAALTWKSEYEAWRKRAEEAEAELRDRIDRLRPKLATAREALRPFARYLSEKQRVFPDDLTISAGSSLARRQLTAGDCRRAAAALAELDKP